MPADHDTRHDTRPLGRTGIHVLPLGIGTNKWRRADRGAVLETYRTIHDAGPCMIDTAEIYFSERVVGDCLRAGPTRAVIASKFLPFPGRTSPRRLMSALDGSLARLGLKTIDLYYVHYPLPLIDVRVFAEGAGRGGAGTGKAARPWLWARASPGIPLPGATKPHHARANLDAVGWRLSETEFDAIDRASAKSGT